MKRKMLMVAMAAAAMLALSGCGAMKPEKVAEKVRQAVEETPCTQTDLDVDMDISVADPATGVEMDVGVQVEGGMRMSYDPDTVYENLKISVEMLGLRMPTEIELYMLQEEDKVACYSNIGGSWLRSEVDAALQNDGSASASIWNLPPEQLSIDEEVTELEGTPAICLIGQITGKEISQALGFLFSSLENSAGLSGENQPDIDWEKITAQVSAYVNKETYLPLRAQISVQGLDEVLAGLMGNGASLSIQNADITVEYASYEPVEPCVLPEGAKEAAEQAQRLLEGNPDNGDGTFTIQESGYYTDITAPEGYVLDYVNYDEVDFYNEELDRKVCYQMWTTADSNDFLFWDLVNEEETLYCGDADGTGRIEFGVVYNQEDFGFALDGFTYPGDYTGKNYYAWANLDDGFYGWILVTIYDGGNTRDTSITQEEVQELLDQVHRYQPPAARQEMADLLDKLEV